MGFPVSSCSSLNQFHHPLPPTSISTSSITKSNSTQLGMGWYSQKAGEEKRSLKTKRILGIACTIIIGIEMGATCLLIAPPPQHQHEHQSIAAVALEMVGYEQQQQHEGQGQGQGGELKSKAAAAGRRWSEKRSCLPWHFNSLETLVPEDLPRLSARRRWQFIIENNHAPPTSHEDDAVIKVANQSKKCFSL